MPELSIVQEYVLCALSNKGKFPLFSTEIPVCVLAGALIELLASESIQIDEKKQVSVTGSLGMGQTHLKSLYAYLKQSKPKKIDDITGEYNFSFSDKKINALVTEIGNSLLAEGCVSRGTGRAFGNEFTFIPKPVEVDRVIQKIRAELLENGPISEETVALVSLLEKGNLIKNYFSKYESEQLKARLQEIKAAPSNQLVKQMMEYVDTMLALIVVITSVT